MSIVSSTIQGSNKALGEIRGFFGSTGFKDAVTTAKRVGNRMKSGALQHGWRSSGYRAAGFGLAGGAVGFISSDRGDRFSDTLKGAAIGAGGFAAYRGARGLYSSGMIGEGMAGLKAAGRGMDGLWGGISSAANDVSAWEKAGMSTVGGGSMFNMRKGFGAGWAPGASGPASRLKYGMRGGKVSALRY